MGILNITNDSFYDGGKFTHPQQILMQAGKMLSEGAAIIDIGAASSRPGAVEISLEDEINKLIPAIEIILKKWPDAIVSADTYRWQAAKATLDAGAKIINDIYAGLDDNMMEEAAKNKCPYILMHMKGNPQTMQTNPEYKNVVKEVLDFLAEKVTKAKSFGITDIIVDPGFGFGKTVEHNFSLLKNLNLLKMTGAPVLAGLSRKSMICKTLHINPHQALNGTSALNMVALMNGANILRVHDVKEAMECITLYNQLIVAE